MALRLRNQAVNCHHILLHLIRNIQMTTDDMLNVMETAVMMMRVASITVLVGVLMAVFMGVLVIFMLMGMLVGVLVIFMLMEMIVMLMARAFMIVLMFM